MAVRCPGPSLVELALAQDVILRAFSPADSVRRPSAPLRGGERDVAAPQEGPTNFLNDGTGQLSSHKAGGSFGWALVSRI